MSGYNAHNHYLLRWFADRVVEIDPEFPQRVTLVPFVHNSYAGPNEFIIVRVGDLYMQYNRAIDYNADSGEHADKLVVVRDKGNGGGTDLIIGLDAGEEYREGRNRGEEVTIHVCDIQLNAGYRGADILTVSVGYGDSMCNYNNYNPQPSPSSPTIQSPSSPVSAPSTPNIPPSPQQPTAPTLPNDIPSAPTSPQPPSPSIPTPVYPTEPSPRQPSRTSPPDNSPVSVPTNNMPPASNQGETTLRPTFIAGDSLDDERSNGITQDGQPAKQPEKNSGLLGILVASFCVVAALLALFIVYRRCCYKQPKKVFAVSPYNEKDLEDAEKASVHSSDSDTTASSEESFATEFALPSPGGDIVQRIGVPVLASGRSIAQSIATSCALAGVIDEEVDTGIVEKHGHPLHQHFRLQQQSRWNSDAQHQVKSSPRARSPSPTKRRAIESGDTQTASWMEWIGVSSWMQVERTCERAAVASCDVLTNVCGYGTNQVDSRSTRRQRNVPSVML